MRTPPSFPAADASPLANPRVPPILLVPCFVSLTACASNALLPRCFLLIPVLLLPPALPLLQVLELLELLRLASSISLWSPVTPLPLLLLPSSRSSLLLPLGPAL